MKYFIKTYGCQMNKSDSERIAFTLKTLRYKKTEEEKDADLIVINCCSVRQSAIDRVFGTAVKYKRLKKLNPSLKTILTGCVLEKDRKKFREIFDFVINIKDIGSLPKILTNNDNKKIISKNLINKEYLEIEPDIKSNFTAYIPIMTGCNNYCSYCVVPYTRGGEYSRKAEKIICQVKKLSERGYRDIALIGQNVSGYKSKYAKKQIDFSDLIKKLNNISGDFWIRFMTSHPKDMNEKLIKTVAESKKCSKHIHLALQSGDDEILKKMNRKYTVSHFLGLIEKIRKFIPDANITTDIIVGFPTETEKQFQNTVKVMKKAKFDMAYINKYSPRFGTASARLLDNVDVNEKKRREKILTEVLKETALENNNKYTGNVIETAIEKIQKTIVNKYTFTGRTKNFKKVKIYADRRQNITIGKLVNVKITKTDAFGLEGTFISD